MSVSTFTYMCPNCHSFQQSNVAACLKCGADNPHWAGEESREDPALQKVSAPAEDLSLTRSNELETHAVKGGVAERRLGAKGALFIFLGYEVPQLLTGAIFAFVALVRGVNSQDSYLQLQHDVGLTPERQALAFMICMVVGAIVVIILVRRYARGSICGSSADGIAWSFGTVTGLTLGFVVGGFLCIYDVLVASQLIPPAPEVHNTDFRMMSTPGMFRTFYTVAAVALAPPVEEFLFRGVLFSGLSRSWGRLTGGVLTTVLFVLIHLDRIIEVPDSAIGTTVLGVCALALRIRAAAVGPAVALHFAWNLSVTLRQLSSQHVLTSGLPGAIVLAIIVGGGAALMMVKVFQIGRRRRLARHGRMAQDAITSKEGTMAKTREGRSSANSQPQSPMQESMFSAPTLPGKETEPAVRQMRAASGLAFRTVMVLSVLWGLVTLTLGLGALLGPRGDLFIPVVLLLLMGQGTLWVPFYVLHSSAGVSRNARFAVIALTVASYLWALISIIGVLGLWPKNKWVAVGLFISVWLFLCLLWTVGYFARRTGTANSRRLAVEGTDAAADHSRPTIPSLPPSFGAGFWIRAAARLIDTAYGLVLGLIGGMLAWVILTILQAAGATAPGWAQRAQGFNPAGYGLSLLGMILYYSVLEGLHGASLGKLVCRLRVITADGLTCSMTRAILRSLAFYWDALFFGLVGYYSMSKSALNQRYGDVWAKTVVVRTSDVSDGAKRPLWRFFLGFSVGSACWMFMFALGFILKARQ